MNSNEAFSRVKIDALLKSQGWNTLDLNAVRFEVVLPDGTRADYALCDRHGRAIAVVEAKRFSISPGDAAGQAREYARQLGVPFVFLSNGSEVQFWEWEKEAFPHSVKTFFKQDDLERRFASRQLRRDPLSVPIDRRIVERDYQIACIDTLCKEIGQGRRKLLVEMATGTGKTRTAALARYSEGVRLKPDLVQARRRFLKLLVARDADAAAREMHTHLKGVHRLLTGDRREVRAAVGATVKEINQRPRLRSPRST